MPGIVGIVSQRPVAECQRLVKAMVASMEHELFYVSGTYDVPEMGIYGGWIAHEDSFTAGQPFFSEQRDIALILSGECFLDSQTGAELGRKWHDVEKNKAEWLVHLYEEEGEQFFEKLNGLFSGLLIDKKRQKALLFNDRYSSERIYWHETKDATYFASEAKAILRVLPETRAFNEQGVADFLVYGCTLEGRTLFRGIELLPGGSFWSFQNGKCQKRKYFSPEVWETQDVLQAEEFTTSFRETFNRIIPRYFESETRIGISLTGGLDTRMIMASRPQTEEKPVCYTFSGQSGETMDDRVAHRVARACGLEHELLRIGSDFFSDFAQHVDRTVFVTDGCFGATGAHEIYLNRQARQLASIRLTGNYGSEVLRGVSTLKRLGLSSNLIEPRFAAHVSAEDGVSDKNPITFAAFTEIPWGLYGSLAAGRSQVRFRTPYLDNEIVGLAYRAPENLRRSRLPAWHLIEQSSPSLSSIPTDRRSSPRTFGPVAALKRLYAEATFKLDYLNNEGWPSWLSPVEPIFTRFTSTLKIVGLHKYLHYRNWFRRELTEYVNRVVNDPQTQRAPFWNRDFLGQLANEHISGRRNYILEINAVLTLEAVERLLMRDFSQECGELIDSRAPIVSLAGAKQS